MIEQNLERITNQLLAPTKLLAVSKTKPITDIEKAYNWGQRDFGENKVQDLFEKASQLNHLPDIRWHFIGTLQSNKLNKLLKVPNLYAIHSLDKIELVEKILTKSAQVKVFLQINTSGEDEKSGFSEIDHIEESIRLLQGQHNFELLGLMTIGSIRADDFEAAARASFQKLRDFKTHFDDKYQLNLQLSMGMSQDFKIAMEFGSHWVRIGTQIFGKRS